jgi:hypothetical protein
MRSARVLIAGAHLHPVRADAHHDLAHGCLLVRRGLSAQACFAGAPMTDALLNKLRRRFARTVNHGGSSEIYTHLSRPPPPSLAPLAAPASTSRSAWSASAPARRRAPRRPEATDRAMTGTNRSRAIGAGPTPTPRRSATDGISPATPG